MSFFLISHISAHCFSYLKKVLYQYSKLFKLSQQGLAFFIRNISGLWLFPVEEPLYEITGIPFSLAASFERSWPKEKERSRLAKIREPTSLDMFPLNYEHILEKIPVNTTINMLLHSLGKPHFLCHSDIFSVVWKQKNTIKLHSIYRKWNGV